MTLKLSRQIKSADGVFSHLLDKSGNLVCFTLEHSYRTAKGDFLPKLPNGTYQCVLGSHELHSSVAPFHTYEIQGVPSHSGILFHTGNKQRDSEGCVLLGTSIIRGGSMRELAGSRLAFDKFLKLCNGASSFTLVVEDSK